MGFSKLDTLLQIRFILFCQFKKIGKFDPKRTLCKSVNFQKFIGSLKFRKFANTLILLQEQSL